MPADTARIQKLLAKAKRCIEAVPYQGSSKGPHPVSLITFDSEGFASARTVVPREFAEDLSFILLNTRKDTRKVGEIQHNPKVSLNFQDQRGRGGWLTMKGVAELQPLDGNSVNILVTIVQIEGVSYNEDFMADREGWKPMVLRRVDGRWAVAGSEASM